MFLSISDFYNTINPVAAILISLAVILFSGFFVTRITKRFKLPNVSGYIAAGVIIGPYALNLVPKQIISDMGFISDIALTFIAFGVGKFFKKSVLKKTGIKPVIITLFESLAAGIAVSLSMRWFFNLSWDFSLLLGAIATATAPASTMMTINQYKAKGKFVNTLLQVVAIDDVICLLIFSAASAIITAGSSGPVSFSDIVLPLFYNIIFIIFGFLCGLVLTRLLKPGRSKDNRLILAIAMLLGIAGLCGIVNISPLLACMVFGAAYINLTSDKKLYKQLNTFTPPIMSLFFIVSGMNLDITAFKTAGLIGVVYFIIRILGKYCGAWLGASITGAGKAIRKYLGVALIPQAGVAIGLAFLAQRILPADTGNMLNTIILSSSVLYELVGPASAKAALFLSGAIKNPKTDASVCSTDASDISADDPEETKELTDIVTTYAEESEEADENELSDTKNSNS